MAVKNRIKFSSTLEKELREKLKSLSTLTRIDQSLLLDEAVEDLLKKHNYDELVKGK